ncbi:MAG: hypothetical protein HY905_13965 [Deltaproteobacteria bacterium]|nr:hypothetical protein [Deltaproteobacteria bacterium]
MARRFVGCLVVAAALSAGAGSVGSAAAQTQYPYDSAERAEPFGTPAPLRHDGTGSMEGLGEIIGMAIGVGVGMIVMALALMLVFVSVVGYVVARWRAGREGVPLDPQLGVKTGLWFFRMLACHVALAGTAMFMYALMTKMGDNAQKDLFRVAGGLLVPGVLVYAATFALSFRTNARQLPLVTRLFAGANLLFVGLLAFSALVAAFVLAFQKEPSVEAHRFAWSAVLVYLPAWVVQFALVFRRGGLFGGSATPASTPSTYPPIGPSLVPGGSLPPDK